MASLPSVVLLGSKPGSVVALRCMLERGWEVRCVVATPGETLHDAAVEAGVSVVAEQTEVSDERVDFVISYMCRRLVGARVRGLATRAALNFHAAPLPEYGGWAFYNVAILERAPEFGVTCHHMDDDFDGGPLLEVRRFPIRADEHTALSLERLAQQHMVALFADFCALAESGAPLPREPQDPARKRYMKRDEFEQLKRIPDDATAEQVQRYARAFYFPPYPGAYLVRDGRHVEVSPV